jgi:CDP-glycerol glycerophosphotransferase (TagB/SpsB family)
LEEKMLMMKNKVNKEILFVSQGSITDSLIDIAIGLSKKLGDSYRIIYRLHPNEIGDTLKYNKLHPYKNISISDSGDIYKLMGTCQFVIGSYSAVMFEALLFQKPVFIQKNQYSDEYIPKNMGVRFVDESELFTLICSNKQNNNQSMTSTFWTVGWEKRMEHFFALI